jgi:hypothetical protein
VTEISLYRGPVTEPGEGALIGDFERQVTEGSVNGSSFSISFSLLAL